jgi:hypothetical protein
MLNTTDIYRYKLFTDPGHGWFEVSMSELKELGIQNKISTFSYFDPETDHAYLEEDCDAGVLYHALKDRGLKFETVATPDCITDDSFIRSLPRYPQHR